MLNIIDIIKSIIKTPEYVGTHPKKIGSSIEFVKISMKIYLSLLNLI
ncbi:hypothetical protein QJS64_07950 [Paraclostridium bifermentans]|uniref:Uncharacterized protein n=1 Tax=Paraclostridium bifermentans TaxID=1490 RepID=A0ABY8R7X8_PARBF|nr:hypothetical protein QJS64_07950 [Paraclostridium bifermentans]